jgi:hypothetical protein
LIIVFGHNHKKVAFAAANRTIPVLGQFRERGAGFNVLIYIAFRRVIDVMTDFALQARIRVQLGAVA